MRAFAFAALLCSSLLFSACGPHSGGGRFPTTDSGLALDRVVLYRNGVGYFERRGEVDGDVLRIKVRKDQINDLLKSLTIVDRRTGQAVSVSMPLDPETWANAALATLAPGNGSLAQVLDLLRGVQVTLSTKRGSIQGRIVMVERIEEEPDPEARGARSGNGPAFGNDHKVTLMHGADLRIVRLSKVTNVTLEDGALAMQFHRRLDATAGEGMFQQVEVAIRLDGDDVHDLVVSYVVEAPMWKPTYRVVLPKDGKGEALLQAWAVVDNVSGEDWSNVKIALTAGAPIAFRYDMHTPRRVFRPDVSGRIHSKRARVAMGETSFEGDDDDDDDSGKLAEDGSQATGAPVVAGVGGFAMDVIDAKEQRRPNSGPMPTKPSRFKGKKKAEKRRSRTRGSRDDFDADDAPAFDAESLRRSTRAQTRARHASGLTRYDIANRVTVPDGSATMVALINTTVVGEEVFMFDPRGGGGPGYEQNPFRVVRFKNSTPFVLESGPISIYSGGSFVGEGISDAVGANTSATIPFAVEPSILVTKESPALPQELRLLKIVGGTVHAERFFRTKTVWNVKAQNMKDGFKVLIRHPRLGGTYKLESQPAGLEELKDAYLVPLTIPKGKRSGSVTVVEQTPSQVTVRVHDRNFLGMLERALVAENFSPAERAQLQPLIALRREIGKLDTRIDSLTDREAVLNRRISQHRRNLARLKDMKGAAAARMRQERAKQLEDFTKKGDALAIESIKIKEAREQKIIQLEEMLSNLTIGGKGK